MSKQLNQPTNAETHVSSSTRSHSPVQSMGAASGLAMMGAVITTIANFAIAYLVSKDSTSFAGVFFVATAVTTILGNSSCLGTMTGLVYFLPQTLDGEKANPRDLILKALRPVLALSLTVAVLVNALAPQIAGILSKEGSPDELTSMLRILAVAIVPFALTVTLLGATRGLGSVTPTVLVNQVMRPAGQIILLALLLTRGTPDPRLVAIGWTIPVVLGVFVAAAAVAKLGGWTSEGPPQVSNHEFWGYTRARALSTSMQIALERIDVIIVGALIGQGAAGVYGALSRFISAGNFLMFSVSQAVSPSLRRAISRGQWIKAQGLLRKATGWLVLIAWPYFLILALKPKPFANLLSSDYVDDASIMTVLAVGMMFSAASGPIDLSLLMLGRSDLSLVGVATAIATDLVLLAILAPAFGIMGAAAAWAISVAVHNTIAAFFVHRESRSQNPDSWSLHGPSRASGLAMIGALLAVVPIGLLIGDTFAYLVLAGLIAGPILAAWIYRFRIQLGFEDIIPASG